MEGAWSSVWLEDRHGRCRAGSEGKASISKPKALKLRNS